MANIALSSTHATEGFDMRLRDATSIITVVNAVSTTTHNATQVTYTTSTITLVLNGTFPSYNAGGDPTAGVITSFTLTAISSPTTKTIDVTNVSISVTDFFALITANNIPDLNALIYGGDDTVIGSAGKDTILGFAGNDTLSGGDSDDTIYGDVHNTYTPQPLAGNDTLNGGNGNDTLDGGGGDDIVNGDAGADVIVASSGVDTIDGGTEFDRLTFDRSGTASPISWNLSTFWSTGTFYDGSTVTNVEQVTVLTGANEDTLTIDNTGWTGEYIYNGGVGVGDHIIVDVSAGAAGLNVASDRITLGGSANILRISNIGHITATGGSAADAFVGRAGNDVFSGGFGNDSFNGNDGNDTLNGGEGNDTMNGAAGDDIVNGDGGSDTITYSLDGADQIDGGDGNDGINLNLSSMTEGLSLSIALFSAPSGYTFATGANIKGIERYGNVTFGSGNDTLLAVANNFGGQGANLDGGGGFDRFVGDYTGQSSAVAFTDMTLNGIVHLTGFEQIQITGGTGADTLGGGDGDDTFDGGAGIDVLSGGAGHDILIGGAGADQLSGGAGDDFYSVDASDDVIIEFGGAGVDSVDSSVSYTLSADVENLTLTGGGAINATGNASNNALTGSSGDNVLDGMAGADTMVGGAGNDTYVVDNIGDFVTEISGGGVSDTVRTTLNGYILGANLENLVLLGAIANGEGNAFNNIITGNDAANVLYGRAGNDTLIGGLGADQMLGGNGDDIYFVDSASDITTESAAAGTDSVSSSVTYSLYAYVENLTLTGTAVGAAGNALNNIITGNDVANALSGFAGADTLNGGLGADLLSGGNGNDTLNGGADGDTLDGGGDNDTAIGGDGNDTLYGRTQDDNLSGDAGNDTLYGGDGDDVLSGGTGDDMLDGLNHNDLINGGDGIDTIYGRTGNDTINGDAGADVLYGGDGDDIVNGGAANDQVDGGNGDDTLAGGDGADIVYGRGDTDTMTGEAGNDTLYGGEGDDSLDGGADNDLVDGGNGNDTLAGDDGADTLNGSGGVDTLNGGAGNDTLIGGTGDDAFVFSVGSGSDLVVEFSAGGAEDTLDLSAYSGTGITWSITQVGGDAMFTFTNGDVITLSNVDHNDLIWDGLFGYS